MHSPLSSLVEHQTRWTIHLDWVVASIGLGDAREEGAAVVGVGHELVGAGGVVALGIAGDVLREAPMNNEQKITDVLCPAPRLFFKGDH